MLPSRLKKGDFIGVVSPSGAITKETQLDKGIQFLRKLGFKIIVGRNVLKNKHGSAGTAEERAEDINTMFANKNVKGIICSQGGHTANACLPFLDWKLIRKNPKVFLGISDITVLLNAIYAKTGLITFHGNDVMWGFGRNPTRYDIEEFKDRLIGGKIGKVKKNSVWKTVRKGVGTGKLLGGNLNCILKLAGTPYFPDFSNAILFLEAYRPTIEECEHHINQLKQIGVFEKIKGILVGHIDGMEEGKIKMEDLLLENTKEYGFPILKCHDFGHNCPNTTLPVGVKVRLDSTKRELEILEKCVK